MPSKETVLVTGGLGFIGSHVVDFLISSGFHVVVVDKKSDSDFINPEAEYFLELDVSDLDSLRRVFIQTTPHIIIHCAAEARIQPSFDKPELYFRSNVEGTFNLLSLATGFRSKRIVFLSSSSVYGNQDDTLLREEMALPVSLTPYALSKKIGELIMEEMAPLMGGPETVCLRLFNVYGPRQPDGEDGSYPTIIGTFLKQLWKNHPLSIVSSGYQRRDFTWVGDVVGAVFSAAFSRYVGKGEIINIGTGRNYSIWEVARLVLGATTNVSPMELISDDLCVMLPERRGEAYEVRADVSKARGLLSWSPKISLETGMALLKGKKL